MTPVASFTPRARALVKAGQKAFRPAAGDCARLGAALLARLGAAIVSSAGKERQADEGLATIARTRLVP